MKRRYLVGFLFLFPALVFLQAQQEPVVFTNVTVIDGTGAPAQPDMTVVVANELISDLGKTGTVLIPNNAEIIDASGKFLIPGLWDMHVHTRYDGIMFLPLFIANGVTGIRDVHGPLDHFDKIKQWRQEIAEGKLIGPRIIASGPLVDGPGSRWWPDGGPVMVTSPAGGREIVSTLKRRGVDFIKVYDLLSKETYDAVIAEAKKEGLPFIGHIPFSVSAAEASDVGQKSIEHLSGILLASSSREEEFREELVENQRLDGSQLLDTYSEQKAAQLFARFQRNETWQTPTLVNTWKTLAAYRRDPRVMDPLKYMPTYYKRGEAKVGGSVASEWNPNGSFITVDDVAEYERRFNKYLEIVADMRRVGVEFLTGTDTLKPYNLPGFSLLDELELLVEAGLTPLEALQAGTINPARFLGIEDSLGTVEKGKYADLVLLGANPLEDISHVREIEGVVTNGRFLPKSSLEKMLAEVEEAASQR